jgi:hypothetical protein
MTEPNPEQPSAEPIVVSYTLTPNEYRQYAAAVSRRNSSWLNWYLFFAVVFLAIPVALLFRSIAAESIEDPEAVELTGRIGLYAYGAGVTAAMIWGSIVRSILRKRYYKATMGRPEVTTAVIDRLAITVTLPGIEAKWQWAAVEACTFERGLLLVWIGPGQAATIPRRSFETPESCNQALAFIRTRLAEAKRPAMQPQA